MEKQIERISIDERLANTLDSLDQRLSVPGGYVLSFVTWLTILSIPLVVIFGNYTSCLLAIPVAIFLSIKDNDPNRKRPSRN